MVVQEGGACVEGCAGFGGRLMRVKYWDSWEGVYAIVGSNIEMSTMHED
jgi:hypothetical protein